MTLTLAILSWKSHGTLLNTLDSYVHYGLDKLADQKVIFFQEIGETDLRIADIYGYEAIGAPNNIGIADAYKQLVEYATGDLFLFLENDWLLIEPPEKQIIEAEYLVGESIIDVAKFRHRQNPGSPLWSSQYKGNELSRAEFLLDAMHWTDNVGMEKFEPLIHNYNNWFFTSSRYANWTNNPTMFRTEWLGTILPRLDGDIEKALQPWWRQQNFSVAQGPGLFTHMRLDR